MLSLLLDVLFSILLYHIIPMRADREQYHAGRKSERLRKGEMQIPTKVALDADCALRLADMAEKNGCSKADIVNALIGRHPCISNVLPEVAEYTALGCREW